MQAPDSCSRFRSSAPEEASISFLLRFNFKNVLYLSADYMSKVVSRALESHGQPLLLPCLPADRRQRISDCYTSEFDVY
jgi:hypothetical protein